MSSVYLAGISVGQHWTVQVLGQPIYLDTVVSTLVAGLAVLGAGLYLRHAATSGVPGKFQTQPAHDKTKHKTDQHEPGLGMKTIIQQDS